MLLFVGIDYIKIPLYRKTFTVFNDKLMFCLKKSMTALLTVLLLVTTLTPVFAQEQEKETKKERKVQWVPLPVVMYQPVNGLGLGVLGMALFKPGQVDSTTRTSQSTAYFIYTTEGQLMFSPDYTIFFNKDEYILKGKFRYFDFPQTYYGIGQQLTPDSLSLKIDYKRISFDQEIRKKIAPGIYAGLQYRYNNIYNVSWEESDSVQTIYDEFMGQRGETDTNDFFGYRVSGIGLNIAFDTRDNIANATQGHFLRASANFHGKVIGSEYNFSTYTIDARKYIQPFKNLPHVLAVQAFGNFTSGYAPFMELSSLGGELRMRGYTAGRYRENHYMTMQAEYRMPIYGRVGLAAFGGFGDVANQMSDFSLGSMKPSYGAGLRFMINRKERVNIRADYAFGANGSSGFYLQIQEAF